MGAALRAAQRRRIDRALLARPGRKHPDRETPAGACAGRCEHRRHHEECAQRRNPSDMGCPDGPRPSAKPPARSMPTDLSSLSIRFAGRPVYRLPMTLRPPQGQSFDVIVPLVGRDAVIALADGAILAPGRQVDIGALRGAVAVSPRRTVLHLGAKGSKSGSIKIIVDGELPLGILRGAIDETLATLPNQDDLVEIDFIGDSRPPIRISRYRHEQLVRDGATVRWLAPSTRTGASPVTRMILDPRHEHALEPQGDGFWQAPGAVQGTLPRLSKGRRRCCFAARPGSAARRSRHLCRGPGFGIDDGGTTRSASARSSTRSPGSDAARPERMISSGCVTPPSI